MSSSSSPAHSPLNPLSDLPLSPNHRTFTITAHNTGFLHLPPRLFISPAPTDPAPRRQPVYVYVLRSNPPHSASTSTSSSLPPTTLLFDLGLRSPLTDYPPAIVHRLSTVIHAELAEPAPPLPTKDVHALVISHVHYDHIGDPKPWIDEGVEIVVGEDARDLLVSGGVGSHEGHYEKDLLKDGKVRWVRPPEEGIKRDTGRWMKIELEREGKEHDASDMEMWLFDLLEDGSVWIVDAPGHLPGHLNLLVRVQRPSLPANGQDQGKNDAPEEGGEEWVYLAADTCHDSRILRGECSVAEYQDVASGCWRCAHHDKAAAEAHTRRVRRLEEIGVTVLLSHEESADPRFR